MIKLIIYLGLGYLLYRAIRSLIFAKSPPPRTAGPQNVGQIDDIMVKDPYCETHIPKKDSVHLKIGGEDLYFCSSECRDKYLARPSTDNTRNE
jgi:YHS domain-containing protein